VDHTGPERLVVTVGIGDAARTAGIVLQLLFSVLEQRIVEVLLLVSAAGC